MKCKLQRKNERYINSRREDVPAKSVECILTCSDEQNRRNPKETKTEWREWIHVKCGLSCAK